MWGAELADLRRPRAFGLGTEGTPPAASAASRVVRRGRGVGGPVPAEEPRRGPGEAPDSGCAAPLVPGPPAVPPADFGLGGGRLRGLHALLQHLLRRELGYSAPTRSATAHAFQFLQASQELGQLGITPCVAWMQHARQLPDRPCMALSFASRCFAQGACLLSALSPPASLTEPPVRTVPSASGQGGEEATSLNRLDSLTPGGRYPAADVGSEQRGRLKLKRSDGI